MLKRLVLAFFVALVATASFAANAVVDARPSQIDISSATSESAVLVTVSAYTSDVARYRLYNGSNQYNCWDQTSGTYISSISYSAGPRVPGTPTTSSTWWIMFQRGNNATTTASYRDRLDPSYSTNYMTAALPTATAITSAVSITNSNVTFTSWTDYANKYVVLGYDAPTGGTLISATSTGITTGAFDLKVENGTTIQRIEIRDVLNNLVEAVTGTWPSVATPTIVVSGTLNPFTTYTGTASASQSYNLSGFNLTAGFTVTPPAGFELSTDNSVYTPSLSLASTFNGPIYVRLTGTTAGSFSGVVTNASAAATTVDVAVSGTVSNPTPIIHATGTLNSFSTLVGTPSAYQTYTLSGEFLTANIGITAPTGFEISFDNISYTATASVAPTFNGSIYVRLTGTTVGTFSGNISHTSTGAPQVDLAVNGAVTEPIGPTLFMEENFAYTEGTLLMDNGWVRHSGTGTNPPSVAGVNLSYPGYIPNSGLSGQTLGNGDDVHKNFAAQTSGSVYTSFLLNVSSATVAGDYTYMFATNADNTSDFKAKFFVGKNETDNLRFGLTKQSNLGTGVYWTGYDYALNTTYLVVLKYEIVSGAANDIVTGWINPLIGITEPAPMLTTLATESDIGTLGVGSVAIRQSSTTPVAKFDGIRVSNDWATLWSGEEPPTPVIIATGTPDPVYNIVGNPSEEVSFYNLSGTDLVGPINIVAPTHFEVSTSELEGYATSLQVPSSFNGPIYVRMNSSEVGEHVGFVTHNSTGAAEVTVRVEGETFPADVTWNVVANLTPFTHVVGTPSDPQSYTLSATNATGNIAVSVGTPFELGTASTGPWGASLDLAYNFNGSVYVRMNSAVAGDFNANILHVTANATNYELPVSGTATPPAGDYAEDIFISEYTEAGSGSNKAIELFNGTGLPVDLSAYTVKLASNGGAWSTTNVAVLTGYTLAHNEVFVIANASATQPILDVADMTSTVTFFNGDDAVGLFKNDILIDIIGVQGVDPGAAWPVAGVNNATADHTLIRKPVVVEGNTDWTVSAGTNADDSEWIVIDWTDNTNLGTHTFAPGVPQAAAPILTPAGGVYISAINVTMSSTTPGATIYYTIDGSVPSDTNGFNYAVTGPYVVSATTTVKAITYAAGYTPSSVTTEIYMFPIPIADIATLRAQATGTTVYKLTGEAVLTFQQANRNQKYIQDATAAILIDDPSPAHITSTYNLYDGITGVTGTLGLYNEMLQFTPVADPGAATSLNNVIIPEVRTLASLTPNDQAKLIKVMNVTVDATLVTYPAGAANINVTDPTATLVMRTFPATDYSGTPIHTVPVNITCLAGQYLTTMQISPRFLADFEVAGGELGSPIVTITEAAGTVTLTWETVAGATSYRIEAADDPYGTYTTVETTSLLTVSFPSNPMKFYRVYAIN